MVARVAFNTIDGSERLDACVQTRQLARRGVALKDTGANAALNLRLRFLEGGLRCGLVAAGDRGLELLDEVAHAAPARAVHCRAALGLADALLGRLMLGHSACSLRYGKGSPSYPRGGGL